MGADGNHESLPIFPLADVVVFPGARVPLHLFEPRYRQMVRDALAGERRIGMVVVRPEYLSEMPGDPPVFEIGCEGQIDRAEKLPDGRYNIDLLGTRRFRILDELPRDSRHLYRSARIEPLDEEPGDPDRVPAQRKQIIEMVRQLLEVVAPERANEISPGLFDGVEDIVFVNSLAQSLEFSAVEKQALLEANSVSDRCDGLSGLLRFRLAELGSPGASEPGPRH